jgi:tripartite-type tricarboxylate transporter receptor subunit TctC
VFFRQQLNFKKGRIMKFLTTSIVVFLLTISTIATAKEYLIINPNTAGSLADTTARVLAEAYKKRTGNTLIVQNVGGGYQIPGVVHFKQLREPAIMINTTGTLVFNQKMMQNLPYQDEDFDHVSAISLTPAVWVVRVDSPYHDMKDLVKTLPASSKPFVGYSNTFELANIRLLSQKYNWGTEQDNGKITAVKYKGPSEVVLGLLGNDLNVAMVALLPAVVEQVKAGKLRILASTINKDIVVAGQRVPSAEQLMKIDQFPGGAFLSLSPKFNPDEAKQLKKDLIESLKDPIVVNSLTERNQHIMEVGPEHMINFINNYRKKLAPLSL